MIALMHLLTTEGSILIRVVATRQIDTSGSE